MAAGTKEDPWRLKTPPGTSEYSMYKDAQATPPALVCQVGSTTLKYHLRAIEDLHAWLSEQDGWVPLGAADEKNQRLRARSRRGAGRRAIQSAAGTDCATGTAAGSACTSRHCWKSSGWPSSPMTLATTKSDRSANRGTHL